MLIAVTFEVYKEFDFVMDGLPPANEKSAVTISNSKHECCIQKPLEN